MKIITSEDVKFFYQISSRYIFNESLQTTVCFLWSVLSRSCDVREYLFKVNVAKTILKVMTFQFPKEQSLDYKADDSSRNVLLSSRFVSFTKNDMLKMFCAVSLMHLADLVPNQLQLLNLGALGYIVDCICEINERKQILFLMQFILQRLVKRLDSPVAYEISFHPCSLRSIASFACQDLDDPIVKMLIPIPRCSKCNMNPASVKAYEVKPSHSVSWLECFPKKYSICRSCVNADRGTYGFEKFKGDGVIQLIDLEGRN